MKISFDNINVFDFNGTLINSLIQIDEKYRS
jgi:hypothetical protein